MKWCCLAMIAALAAYAFGYGEEEVAGAWAEASAPEMPCLVITNKTAWVLKDGMWRPGMFNGNRNEGGTFRLLGEEMPNRWDEVVAVPELIREALSKVGVAVAAGEFVWVVRERQGNREPIVSGRKIARCAMPDWNKIRREKDYVGFWKPVRFKGRREETSGAEVENALRLKIRDDGIAVFFYPTAKLTRERPEPYRIERIVPVEGGMRFDYREKYKRYDDPLNCMYRALWLDGESRLQSFGSDDQMTFVRTQETFADPIDARQKMVRERAYHGVWGVSSEFNIMIVSFDRKGKGVLSFFMGMLPFDWTCGADGAIVCTPDPEMAVVQGWEGGAFVCRYAPEKNQMTVEFPTVRADADSRVKSRTVDYMSADVHVDEVLQRMEKSKKRPNWKMELERAKSRRKEKSGSGAVAR